MRPHLEMPDSTHSTDSELTLSQQTTVDYEAHIPGTAHVGVTAGVDTKIPN